MGIELIILAASIFGNDYMDTHQYQYSRSRVQMKQAQIQQQVILEKQDINTLKILKAIESSKK